VRENPNLSDEQRRERAFQVGMQLAALLGEDSEEEGDDSEDEVDADLKKYAELGEGLPESSRKDTGVVEENGKSETKDCEQKDGCQKSCDEAGQSSDGKSGSQKDNPQDGQAAEKEKDAAAPSKTKDAGADGK